MVKVLLIPLAILAFLVFLIILGAIGLGIAFAILATVGKIWRLVSRSGSRQRS
jgi:hypothetical protein